MYGMSLWLRACWDRGFESRRGHECREYCVLSRGDLCDGSIAYSEKLTENAVSKKACTHKDCRAQKKKKKKKNIYIYMYILHII